MSGIVGVFKDLYIRFMVWLGAEAPSGYEHLVEKKPAPPKPPAPKPVKPEPVPEPVEEPEVPAPIVELPAEVVEPEEIPVEEAEPTVPIEAEPEAEEEPITPDKEWLEAGKPPVVVKEEPEEAPAQLPLEPEAPPLPLEAPPAEAVPLAKEMVFRYEVQRGDTFNAIARRYGLTVKELLEANNIDDPNRIYPGQKLIIPGYMLPGPELEMEAVPAAIHVPVPDVGDQFVYTVAGGDTLNTIAKRYGITLRELIEANNLKDPQLIHVGQKIIIPGVLPEKKITVETDPDFPPVGPLDAVRALYVSYFALGHPQTRKHILHLLDTTELNAVVIDAKSDFGWISYPTKIPLAREVGADRPGDEDFDEFMARLKAKGIYTIARLVTFKDSPLVKSRPELAVKNESGRIWQDSEKSHWSDPFFKPVWVYNMQVAREAAQMGFDEIQFDYLRFPSAGQFGTPHYSRETNKDVRVSVITGFLSWIRGQLKPFDVKISARSLGYLCWRKDDYGIGHNFERMAEYLDVLCPMLYPSTFDKGIPGYKVAVAHPYEVVQQSAQKAVERVGASGCKVRPWIQDFPDYRFDKRVFAKAEIQAQIKGGFDAGCTGFMVWNPNAQYTEAAYAPAQTKP